MTRRSIPPATLLIAAGVALRLAAYLADRGYWSDERSLAENLVGVAPWDLTPLRNSQLAPPLYLALERGLVAALGDSRLVARLPSLLAGIASLFLFRRLADRLLTPRGALLALALFTLSDEQIYNATELKPYILDVAVALAIALAALDHLAPSPPPGAGVGPALLAGVSIGLSFPAVFALAAAGLAGVLDALRRHDPRRLAAWIAAGLLWVAALVATRAAALALLGGRDDMWRFWEFAFPPPLTADPGWVARRLLFLFVCPLDWHGPFDPRLSALPAILCAAIGLVVVARSRPLAALVLIGPLGFALLAAALRLYPFHGRMLLFGAPALVLLVAAGADGLMARLPRSGRVALVVALLAHSAALDLVAVAEPRQRVGLNPVGDRRSAQIDPDLFALPASPHRAGRD